MYMIQSRDSDKNHKEKGILDNGIKQMEKEYDASET
jgi:hypothetical protein